MVVLLTALRYQISALFTKDEEVMEIMIDVFPIATAMQVFDWMSIISHGLLRGIGRQEFAGYLNLATYYIIALPLSLSTAFQLGWQIKGLWTGITAGLFM